VIRVAIIGCGKVADKHVSQIQRMPGCEIVGACDQEHLMARQLAERYRIPHHFADVDAMLATCCPNVVHITTPPQSHHALAKHCLESGCHVYVEKPFVICSTEAEELVAIAEKSGCKLTVGHETQFMHASRDMRCLIQSGYLGGAPVHMESTYCYEFSNETYAKALLGNRNHWVRSLPGGLLQNIISHGIGKIVEYMQDRTIIVNALGFTSPFLQSIGEGDIADELRVTLHGDRGTTAYFTFSSQIGPPLHQFRVYGPRNSLIADLEHQTLIQVNNKRYKSYLNQFFPPVGIAKQYFVNAGRNIRKFLSNDFHSDSGIYYLIQSFYRSLSENTPLPISYRDILMTTRIMDQVFAKISRR
jgi:predicted dehydrogenase